MRPIESLLLRGVNPALIFRGGVGGRPKTLLISGSGCFSGSKSPFPASGGPFWPVRGLIPGARSPAGARYPARPGGKAGGKPGGPRFFRALFSTPGAGGAAYFSPAFFFGDPGKEKTLPASRPGVPLPGVRSSFLPGLPFLRRASFPGFRRALSSGLHCGARAGPFPSGRPFLRSFGPGALRGPLRAFYGVFLGRSHEGGKDRKTKNAI